MELEGKHRGEWEAEVKTKGEREWKELVRQRWMARIEFFDAKGKDEAGFKVFGKLLDYGL